MPRAARPREPLSRERILRAALAFVDEHGLEALTMRRIAQELGVEAMSLYNHVANKDEILDGLIETVATEIELPPPGADWKEALRHILVSAQQTLLRHRWAQSLWMARGMPGPARLSYAESILRTLREAGFSKELTYHAFHMIEALVLGVTTQHMSVPENQHEFRDVAQRFIDRLPKDDVPYLIEHAHQHFAGDAPTGGFAWAVDLIIEGLERELQRS
jgi:AcrR family transcriptional regulator